MALCKRIEGLKSYKRRGEKQCWPRGHLITVIREERY